MAELIVVKVGGSLFTWPDLLPRLRTWLATLTAARVLLVPGGGASADVIRHLDTTHGLGAEAAHWLALRAVQLNAQWLAPALNAPIVTEPALGLSVLDGFAFAQADEANAEHLPHTWDATSDSLAARVAQVFAANELILLKSIALPANVNWTEAAARGWVDPLFPGLVRARRVRAVQLRTAL